ncbi:hypothetical protein BDK51DRAFT_29793 [Blyttiomyces helicus]|uniref:Uncharacterized protein n=1 Tax=Blyttiomyces helicus TaxID=388810 RepID=A0A4P9WPW5_9FUNG|nr:hypothetical protein BDK51DRAFT_29793 [Blyttiomyces helicus]|eukprot:RKO94183.1 hypothetical protein BDK51DRAFT_29793 [Blyttiomyces helicus]
MALLCGNVRIPGAFLNTALSSSSSDARTTGPGGHTARYLILRATGYKKNQPSPKKFTNYACKDGAGSLHHLHRKRGSWRTRHPSQDLVPPRHDRGGARPRLLVRGGASQRALLAKPVDPVAVETVPDAEPEIDGPPFACPITLDNTDGKIVLLIKDGLPLLHGVDKAIVDQLLDCPLALLYPDIDDNRRSWTAWITPSDSRLTTPPSSPSSPLGNPDLWFPVLAIAIDRCEIPYLDSIRDNLRSHLLCRLEHRTSYASLTGLANTVTVFMPLGAAMGLSVGVAAPRRPANPPRPRACSEGDDRHAGIRVSDTAELHAKRLRGVLRLLRLSEAGKAEQYDTRVAIRGLYQRNFEVVKTACDATFLSCETVIARIPIDGPADPTVADAIWASLSPAKPFRAPKSSVPPPSLAPTSPQATPSAPTTQPGDAYARFYLARQQAGLPAYAHRDRAGHHAAALMSLHEFVPYMWSRLYLHGEGGDTLPSRMSEFWEEQMGNCRAVIETAPVEEGVRQYNASVAI